MDLPSGPTLLKIEKNIPIPRAGYNTSDLTKTLIRMDVGDSVLVGKKWFGGINSAIAHRDNKGKKFATRTISQDTKRIWRTA